MPSACSPTGAWSTTSSDTAPTRLIVLPPPCPLDIQPIDFGHADELIEVALGDARELLDNGGEARPPIHLNIDRHVEAA
jgi:NTE family protein